MAGSSRLDYAAMPAPVRRSIALTLGADVVATTNAVGGFTPGPAARSVLSDGRVVFIKACSDGMNPLATAMHRREAVVLAALPSQVAAPELLGTVDRDGWFVLLTEYVDGVMPTAPFDRREVEAILETVTELAAAGANCGLDVIDPVGTHEIERSSRWAWKKLRDEGRVADAGPNAVEHIDSLVDLEAGWVDAASGPNLLHRDLRADNMLLTPTGGVVVDWAAASLGAPWIDLLGLLPDLHLGGGPDPHETFLAHPVGQIAPASEVTCVLASLAGYFTRQSLQPPIPGVSGLREFQAAQAAVATQWLARRMGWNDER